MQQDNLGIWVQQGQEAVSFPASGYEECWQIEDGSFWFRHRNRLILSCIERFPFSGNFADVGGGNGCPTSFLSTRLPGREFFLIEPGYEGCVHARERGLSHVYNMFFQDFPFEEHSIGGVGLFDVLEHIEDDGGFLRQIASRLPSGGMIYLTVPSYEWLWSDADEYAEHVRRYTCRGLRALASRAGLSTAFDSYFFFYLPPMTFLLRTIPYRFGRGRSAGERNSDSSSQHAPGGIVAKVFSMLGEAELRRIKAGRIPFGASCFAVFKKA